MHRCNRRTSRPTTSRPDCSCLSEHIQGLPSLAIIEQPLKKLRALCSINCIHFWKKFHLFQKFEMGGYGRKRNRARAIARPECNWSCCPKMPIVRHLKCGDWLCENCGTVNFAKRSECFYCNRAAGDAKRCFKDIEITEDPSIRPGDWQCQRCGSIVFAGKPKCFNCKCERGGTPPIMHFPQHLIMTGDWFCSKCTFMNYADRKKCYTMTRWLVVPGG